MSLAFRTSRAHLKDNPSSCCWSSAMHQRRGGSFSWLSDTIGQSRPQRIRMSSRHRLSVRCPFGASRVGIFALQWIALNQESKCYFQYCAGIVCSAVMALGMNVTTSRFPAFTQICAALIHPPPSCYATVATARWIWAVTFTRLLLWLFTQDCLVEGISPARVQNILSELSTTTSSLL